MIFETQSFLNAENSDDAYFNFEPDDAELSKLGEELNGLTDEGKSNDDNIEEKDIDDSGEIVSEGEEDIDEDEYEYYEEVDIEESWDSDDDNNEEEGKTHELKDMDDANYMIQKELVEKNMAKLQVQNKQKEDRENKWSELFTALEDGKMSDEVIDLDEEFTVEGIEKGLYKPKWSDEVAEKVEAMMESNNDYVNTSPENIELIENNLKGENDSDSPFIDMEGLEQARREDEKTKEFVDEIESLISSKFDGNTPRSQFMDVNHVAEIGMSGTDAFDDIPEETMDEIFECMVEMTSCSYNVTKWLVYDIDFNVTNLMLAACKHNPEAPILFEHWFPQLVVYDRYNYTRENNFEFTWEDVENADMKELELYYRGFGYSEIPKKAPGETGIIDYKEMSEDDMRIADFAEWVKEVYNPEWDCKDFDDDDIKDVDNVHSPYFEIPRHPDDPKYEDAATDIQNWKAEMDRANGGDDLTKEQKEYRDMVGEEVEYEYIDDKEFTEAFRGHLIIACPGDEDDLEIAEKITNRCQQEFGKQVYVETRIITHAIKDDNVFEIWLESYEIELIHSKRRASIGFKDWTGPFDCDDDEIENIVERVGYLISDDSRYSYRLDMESLAS